MPTIQPILSVLIPSVPSRLASHLCGLMAKLDSQIAVRNDLGVRTGKMKPVEVLALTDNKARSIGLKRQALLEQSRGFYLAFVDDDDDVACDYIDRIGGAIAGILPRLDRLTPRLLDMPGVIVFDTLCVLNGDPPKLIRHGLDLPNTEVGEEGATRTPWCCHAWRRDVAAGAVFPDASYGEDAAWVEHACRRARQCQVPELRLASPPLMTYRWSREGTEAELTYPEGREPQPAPPAPPPAPAPQDPPGPQGAAQEDPPCASA